MPAIRDSMRLHHETVAAAEKHAKKKRSRSAQLPSPVITTTVDYRVWQTAKELAGGDVHRLVQRGDDVYVINNPEKKPLWLSK